MTRKEASEKWQIIKAYGEGKTIQVYNEMAHDWLDDTEYSEIQFNLDSSQYRIKPEENYTIEQNCGENRVEGGVLSVSGSVYEKHYRPFNNCDELIEHYQRKYKSAVGCDIYFPSLYKPCIWIRDKTEDAKGDIELITGFTEHGNVLLNGTSYPLQHLFQMYEFLDGSPCGILEE